MYDEEVPQEVKALPLEDRLSWYEKRVARYMPGYKFLEELNHGLTIDELYEQIEKVQKERREVEAAIFFLERPEFQNLCLRLTKCVEEIRDLGLKRGRLLISRAARSAIDCVAREVTQKVEEAKEIESQIKNACCNAGEVDPRSFLKLHKLGLRL